MLEVDGIVPDSAALAALVTAYVSAADAAATRCAPFGRRLAGARRQFDDRIYEPFLSAAPLGDEAERTEFKLDASGKPSLERVAAAHRRAAAAARDVFVSGAPRPTGGGAAADQFHHDRKSPAWSRQFPHDALEYHDTVMRVLLTPSAYDDGRHGATRRRGRHAAV
jgi:hypothetical protein